MTYCVTVGGTILVELRLIMVEESRGYCSAVSWARWRKLRAYCQVTEIRALYLQNRSDLCATGMAGAYLALADRNFLFLNGREICGWDLGWE